MILQVRDGLLQFLVVLAAVVIIFVVVQISKVSDERRVELVLGFDRHPRHSPNGRLVPLTRADIAVPSAGQEMGREPPADCGGPGAAPGAVGHLGVGRGVEWRHGGPAFKTGADRVARREILTGRGSCLLREASVERGKVQ